MTSKISEILVQIVLIFFLITGFMNSVIAQDIRPADFNKGLELFKSENYIAAEKIFTDLIDQTADNNPFLFDLNYYRLMCLVKQNKSVAENELITYLQKNNGSPWNNQLWFELGRLQFDNQRFRPAAHSFTQVKASLLSKNDQEDFAFFKGYSNFESGNLKQASQSFYEVKRSHSIYAPSASYYWGYINYLEGNYQTALNEFSKLEQDKKFAGFIPYYTIQIYYLQERYDELLSIGEKLIKGAPAEQVNELNKILGDAYYETGKYTKAIKYLDAYEGIKGRKTPEDFFRLGYCYYRIKDYKNAILSFEKATTNKDALSQNAFYHLADCYLKSGNKNKARLAFEQASKFDFDAQIEEDALFNYAKLTYELSYSPFNETIKAFDQYITKYPDSERNDAAFDYLVKVYMSTRNYRDAISSIEKIKNQTPAIKEAYQRVTYFRALEQLNDSRYRNALSYFEKSLENAGYNREYKAKSLYWIGETYYRLRRYNQAIDYFVEFQKTPGAYSTTEYGTAYYNIAYSYFNQSKYEEAASWFRKYLSQSKKDTKKEADAANRVGDYYYLERDYDEAISFYQRSEKLGSYDPDYAIYQQAVCYGLDRQYKEKIDMLLKLIQQYKHSSFVDDAQYEIARTYERKNDINQAIDAYNILIAAYPNSPYLRKAYLQKGLIFYNQEDYRQSLANYKQIIENYPESQEANAALVGIKNNYIDMGNIDAYFAYAETLDNRIKITANEQDSLFYMTAEKNYMDGNPLAETQLEEYLNRYPDGSFHANALFYLAESKYSKGEYSESLTFYEKQLEKADNIFTEPALIKAAELTFNAEKYETSLAYFERLEKLANSKWNLLKARLGMMRCHFAMKQPRLTINAATALLSSDNITELMIREANYKLAKSYYETNQQEEALKYFKLLASDTKSIEGAESKYYLADIYYQQGKYEESEKTIMDFISLNTPHQYWLAKSFILLSDIYLAKEDIFQAKHTLQSIIDNYNIPDDGIRLEAKAKITGLEKIENKTIITKGDTSSVN